MNYKCCQAPYFTFVGVTPLFSFKLPPYRPDPFLFRPSKIKPWMYWFFWLQNQWLLKISFKIKRFTLNNDKQLKHMRPNGSVLVVPTHQNFIDPHVVFDLAYRAPCVAQYMAGIEPFDSARGIFGWFLQSSGSFSVDRGVLDRYAFQAAQKTLDEGKHPLVIFAEGEADYTPSKLQHLYAGAALFALNSAEKFAETPTHPVTVLPIAIQYRLMNPEPALFQDAMAQLYAMLDQAVESDVIELPKKPRLDALPIWDQIHGFLEQALYYLEVMYNGFPCRGPASVTERLENLKAFLLSNLCQEHLGQPAPEADLPIHELMVLKNKLRSITARKLYAPSPDALTGVITGATHYLERLKLNTLLTSKELKQLREWEAKWIGLVDEAIPLEKRLKNLLKHLKQQIPFAELRQTARPEDVGRWTQQIDDTRRIKLMALLLEDMARASETPEDLDGTLMKLEIMLFSQFIYRGPKEVIVTVGDPIDVKAFRANHPEANKTELQEALTQAIRDQLSQGLGQQEIPKPQEASV